MKNEKWDDPTTSGFWSKHLLWNKKSLKDSMHDINKRLKINSKSQISIKLINKI